MSEQVYDHQYKAVLDGIETEGMMEIHPTERIEIFRMGNGTDEVLEVHDFKNVRVYDIHMKYFHCDLRVSAQIPAEVLSNYRQSVFVFCFSFSLQLMILNLRETLC